MPIDVRKKWKNSINKMSFMFVKHIESKLFLYMDGTAPGGYPGKLLSVCVGVKKLHQQKKKKIKKEKKS